MTNKDLPDHKVPFNDPVVKFSSDQIKQLQDKYEFDKPYPLEKALDRVAMFHEQKNYYKPPPLKSEQKQLFNAIKRSALKMEEAALKMEEAIKGLGRSELMLIGKYDCHWISDNKIDQIAEIRRVAERALSDLDELSKPGAPKKEHERSIILKLVQIYRAGTGRTDRYWNDSYYKGAYIGKLVEFIEEIVRIFAIPITNNIIGKTIKEMLDDN